MRGLLTAEHHFEGRFTCLVRVLQHELIHVGRFREQPTVCIHLQANTALSVLSILRCICCLLYSHMNVVRTMLFYPWLVSMIDRHCLLILVLQLMLRSMHKTKTLSLLAMRKLTWSFLNLGLLMCRFIPCSWKGDSDFAFFEVSGIKGINSLSARGNDVHFCNWDYWAQNLLEIITQVQGQNHSLIQGDYMMQQA